MITMQEVNARLARIGMRNRFWGRAEMRELQHIITPEEELSGAVNGRYEGGFCLLIATDRRLLLIDKKPLFLSMEDLRYDMITEVDFCARLIDSTLVVRTLNKDLGFTTIRQKSLRRLTGFVQQRIMELRQYDQQQPAKPLEEIRFPLPQLHSNTTPSSTVIPTTFAKNNSYPAQPLTMRRRSPRFYPFSGNKF